MTTTLVHHPLAAITLAGGLTAVLLLIPWLAPLTYPLRLLMTLVHELGHGLAAILTGGSFRNFIVFPDGGGVAYTAGGWRAVIIPAGYLGLALFGATLILLARSVRWSRVALGVIGAGSLLLTLRYGVPTIFSVSAASGLLTVASGVSLGGLMIWLSRRAAVLWCQFALNFLALQAALSTWSDLGTLIGISSQSSASGSDAQSMANLTYIPALFWALLWAIIAAALIGGAAWVAWVRNTRN